MLRFIEKSVGLSLGCLQTTYCTLTAMAICVCRHSVVAQCVAVNWTRGMHALVSVRWSIMWDIVQESEVSIIFNFTHRGSVRRTRQQVWWQITIRYHHHQQQQQARQIHVKSWSEWQG